MKIKEDPQLIEAIKANRENADYNLEDFRMDCYNTAHQIFLLNKSKSEKRSAFGDQLIEAISITGAKFGAIHKLAKLKIMPDPQANIFDTLNHQFAQAFYYKSLGEILANAQASKTNGSYKPKHYHRDVEKIIDYFQDFSAQDIRCAARDEVRKITETVHRRLAILAGDEALYYS